MKATIISAAVLLVLCQATFADTITLDATADTCIGAGLPNMGSFGQLQFWSGPSYGAKNVLFLFDLAGAGLVGGNVVIDDATLSDHVQATTTETQPEIDLYRLTSPWVEGVTFGPGANWTYADSGSSTEWTTAGGDFDASSKVGISGLTVPAEGQEMDFPGLASLVQGWASGAANDGMIMTYAAYTGDHGFNLSSRETGVGPQLTVTYHVTPEPATMALLAVGGIGALLRRRKA
jgi:hypothetical protein